MDYFKKRGINKSTIKLAVEQILIAAGQAQERYGNEEMPPLHGNAEWKPIKFREGLQETPERVAKSLEFLLSGYDQDPKEVFKTFEDEEKFSGLIYLKDIEFYSMCEHHMLPFYGTAFIAYIPNGRVIGISKLARLLDIYARRLQIQERIGEQVTNALMKYLNPIGAACLIEAKHLCIACRGVQKQNSIMGYSSLKGVFMEESNKGIAARNELMTLWRK